MRCFGNDWCLLISLQKFMSMTWHAVGSDDQKHLCIEMDTASICSTSDMACFARIWSLPRTTLENNSDNKVLPIVLALEAALVKRRV